MSAHETNTTPVAVDEEHVPHEETVSVEEIEGTKEAVVKDINQALAAAAPGGEHERMQERAMMRNYTNTRNRQISTWLNNNLKPTDALLLAAMSKLRDLFISVIAVSTVDEFKEHPIAKLFDGDAIRLEWKAGGLNIVNIKLSFNPTTGYPVVKKQVEIFGNSIAIKHPEVHKLLVEAGVDLSVRTLRDDKPIVKSMIFSVGQAVEIYNTTAATLMKFTTPPSTEVALAPLDIWHTMKPTGFNSLLSFMAERKFTAISRKDLSEWQRDKTGDKEVKITDSNPLLNKEAV